MQLSSHNIPGLKTANRSIFSKAGILLFLIIILLYPASSFQGAKNGLLLWFNTVLPTLLPFMIVSNLIIRLKISSILSKLFYPLFHIFFDVSEEGSYPILIGFLSGMPVGAKTIGDMVEKKILSLREGQYLLSFCNNASPMFIMSYIAISQLNLPGFRVALLLILYGSGVLSAFFIFRLRRGSNRLTAQGYECMDSYKDSTTFDFEKLDAAIMEGFEVITKVGGYMILFSICAQIISDFGSSISYLKLFLISFLEITTGINKLNNSGLDMNIKIALITGITAFGGLSGLAQTKSVISNTRLSIHTYFKGKLLHMILAFLIAYLYVNFVGY
ncbi:sporulation integral membrane protein YlbJ [Anaerocolumna cellulosilytica]|uniref:Sporulation integral membrane protein YlbJ n=1 Tax=Anaerocolumna cellulosilytica TaxID=433286 RepID=A0A6S6QXU5_9FIRM|nr:transporter [Anaerocolumna cellulosilytica]MBB5197444.1 sporulation integral membrane protein YlbJ [Anaerocolumna cellulosilytica]BCJ95464.1 sporulation integral membrane protein YlbJ [Anaerocolumna cellulosilytica]